MKFVCVEFVVLCRFRIIERQRWKMMCLNIPESPYPTGGFVLTFIEITMKVWLVISIVQRALERILVMNHFAYCSNSDRNMVQVRDDYSGLWELWDA